jgi:hypothetical protein
VGLKPPAGLSPYADYRQAVRSVRRSFGPFFLAAESNLFAAVARGPVRLEVGSSPRDRRLAAQLLETVGAAAGQRLEIDRCVNVPTDEAGCRLIVGTHEGLSDHRELGGSFRETLYDRYIARGERLYSAPLVVSLPESKPPTYCLIAPRPEQLAKLSIELASRLLAGQRPHAEPDPKGTVSKKLTFKAKIPAGRPVLRFQPVVGHRGHVALPGDLAMIRFQIDARLDVEAAGRPTRLWREDVPPFCSPRWTGAPGSLPSTAWWRDRVVSLADLAGREVTFHLTAQHVDGRGHPQLTIGWQRVAVMAPGKSLQSNGL